LAGLLPAMDGWKKSPGHNANLLEKRAHEVGIGVAGWRQDGEKYIFHVVQVFAAQCLGKRRSKSSIAETLAGTVDALR
jgi:uncharacterized protein YkwD